MKKRIKLKLDTKEINNLKQQLESLSKKLESELSDYVNDLMENGKSEIQSKVSSVVSDDESLDKNVSVTKDVTQANGKAEGILTAHGSDIAFIEFGTGVHYNGTAGTSPRPTPTLPPNFDYSIGNYGYHLGMLDSWRYEGSDGETHETHGTKAAMPIYYAWRKMKEQACSTARKRYVIK